MTTKTETAPRRFNRNLFLIWQGMAESKIGSVLYSIAIGIWVYEKTDSAAWMGITTAISYFGNMILQPLGGVLADRFNRRNLAAGSDAVCGVAMLALGALALAGKMQVWQVLLVAAISSVCSAVLMPALNALLPQLVEQANLMRASALLHSTQSAIQMIGNAAGGFLVVAFGVPVIILFNGATFLFSAFTECFIRVPDTPGTAESHSILRDFADGIAYLKDHAGLTGMMIAGSAVNLTCGGFVGVVYVWCLDKGMSIEQYGLFLGAESAAMLVATVFITAVPIPRRRRWAVLALASVGYNLLYLGAMTASGFQVCTGLYAGYAFCNMVANMFMYPALMEAIEPAYHGRVLALYNAACIGTMAISMVIYGFLGDLFGVVPVSLAGGVLTLIPALFFVMHPTLRELLCRP